MATVKNDWIGYLDRSYLQIKASVLSRLTLSNPELTDHSESNPFVILVSIFAAIAEMLGYYIDNVGEESFMATAQRRSSIIRHTAALDYRIKARYPESVDLVIIWSGASPSAFTISAGFNVESFSGITFYSLQDVSVPMGASTTLVPIAQVSTVTNNSFGVTDGTKNQMINLGNSYVHKTLQLEIDGQEYEEVDTFAFSTLATRHFIIDIGVDGNAYAILGNGTKGLLETPGLTISVIYRNSLGPLGKVGVNQFNPTSVTFNSLLPAGLAVNSIVTTLSSSGGTEYESSEEIRNNSVRSMRHLERAVNRRDHVDILEALPGVGKAAIHFCCGKSIDLYIVPSGGGVASSGLLSIAQDEIEDKKMVTTYPSVKPAGETRLVVIADVVARKRKSIVETKTDIENALITFGNIENQEINGAVRLSDLQALIDNLSKVDYVTLTGLYTKPYARPINHNINLDWANQTLSDSIYPIKWRLEYDGTNIRITRDGTYIASIAIGAQYVSPEFTFTVNPGGYSTGNMWEFTTYGYLRNLELTDYTILTVSQEDLFITVTSSPINPVVTC